MRVGTDVSDMLAASSQIHSFDDGDRDAHGVGIMTARSVTVRDTAYPLAPNGVLVAGNYIHAIADDPGGGRSAGSGIVILSSSAVQVYNNTVLGVDNAGLYVSASREGDYPQQLDVRDNVLGGARNDLWFSFDPGRLPGLRVDYNHYVRGRVSGGDLGAWRAAGYEGHPSSGDPRVGADGRPLDGSPLRDSGTAVGLVFLGAAPDRGWGEMPGLQATPVLDRRRFLPGIVR